MSGKTTVVLGVTAGIAVYKAADLCSKLSKKYNVLTVMTPNARKLISERIFFTLSGNPVLTDLFVAPDWKPAHVALSKQAELLVVAPCTANFIGKLAHGIADEPLSTTALAFTKQILLAPAMNSALFRSAACTENLELLKQRGVKTVGPETGHLACGDDDIGRMSEPEAILAAVDSILEQA